MLHATKSERSHTCSGTRRKQAAGCYLQTDLSKRTHYQVLLPLTSLEGRTFKSFMNEYISAESGYRKEDGTTFLILQ